MQRYKIVFVIIQCLLSVCIGELNNESKEKLLNGFVGYLNNLPDQIYVYDEGVLLNAQKTDEGSECYYIETELRANDIHNLDASRYLKCSATVQDLAEDGVAIPGNQYYCEEFDPATTHSNVNGDDRLEEAVTDEQTTAADIHQPVHLDNEVQPNYGVTSGEEFIAVPRRQYGGNCAGCSSHVNPQAPGVSDLAALAVRHLDRHEPNTKHSLQNVLDVERQVQVTSGVRYTLTLQVDFDNCTPTVSDSCLENKVCKISILEKTWIKLPDGSKYRTILSNNCTQVWIFGDEGEYIPTNENNDIDMNSPTNIHDKTDESLKPVPEDDKVTDTGSADEIIKVIHNTDVQAQQKTEKSLNEQELKELEEQIIPHHKVYPGASDGFYTLPKSSETNDVKWHLVPEFQTQQKQNTDHSVQYKPEHEEKVSVLNEDRKMAIDDLINFFNSAGFGKVHEDYPQVRIKRSYNHDLKMMSVADKIHKIKKSINKATDLYILAQNMVDYLNEMDLEIKTRVLQDVIAAEEEFQNYQHFFYIQARVVIPCENAKCETKDVQNKICNGIIETTDKDRPQILSAFCYNEHKKTQHLGKIELMELNDPVLLKLTKDSLNKIELESTYPYAMKIVKILEAYTRRASGTITKITVSLSYTNCNKTVPYIKRTNCTIIQDMDSNVCEITVHERHWLNEKKITYICERRPIDEKFSKIKEKYTVEGTVQDKKILDMTEEALQYLEHNSNKNNKQKVVQINSVTTQLIGGLLTEIKFLVGYTTCPSNVDVDVKSCELLDREPLRNCKAQVWDRSWLEDGRQINVECNDSSSENILMHRRKRSPQEPRDTFVGGQTAKDPNDSQFQSLARESLQQFLQSNGITETYHVVKVENVTVQVVAGTLTRIHFKIARTNGGEIHCFSKIWERSWLKSKEIDIKCDNFDNKAIQKREVKSYGGEAIKDPNDPVYKQLARESLEKFLRDYDITQHHELIDVQRVKTQTVAGTLIKIYFTISPTNCTLDSSMKSTTSECKVLDMSNIIDCHSEVWVRPWLKKKDITVNCTNNKQNLLHGGNSNRNKRFLPYVQKKGIKANPDPTLPKYKLLAQEAFEKFKRKHKNEKNESLKYEVTSVENVVKQHVSGIKYYIDFIANSVTCKVKVECTERRNDTLYCFASIWKRPWKGPNEIDVDCNSDVSDEEDDNYFRKKRSILVGAPLEKDINSEHYRKLVEKTLKKYQQLSNAKYVHKVIKIHHVSEQIVAGTLTKLEFSISPTKCLISSQVPVDECNILKPKTVLRCQAEVWDRPWLKSDEDITIDCKKEYTEEIKSGEKNDIVNSHRNKRQVSPTEDYIDEEVKYFYADRAVQHINDKASTNNLQKLITVHGIQNVMNMGVNTVRMYIETAYTFCVRHQEHSELAQCEELPGMYHRLCYVRLWPSPDDELVIESMNVVCDDERDFKSITGISIMSLIRASLKDIEASPNVKYKLVHQGEPNVIPSLDSRTPILLSFVVVSTNCSKHIGIDRDPLSCYVDTTKTPRSCTSSIWMVPNSKKIRKITSSCKQPYKQYRSRRSISLDSRNVTSDEKTIQNFVRESLEKLEMSSVHKYKQRVLQINSYNTKIVKGRLTTIDFDVGYTSCLKYEWVDNITQCEFIEHLPRRHCISQIQERLWLDNGKKIDVSCEDDETPLEATIEFESAENAMQLGNEALKHIEAKYPHSRKQKVVRIFSLDKQEIAGVHYRIKMEVGYTDCLALSIKDDCQLVNDVGLNKFCRANIWLRPWTDHPPTFRVSCDYQDGITNEMYHKIQTEHLFSDFLTTYKPDYINDHVELLKRYEIFESNVRKIHEFNTHERGTARYAVTRFSDLTYEEFAQKYLGLKPDLRDTNQIPIRKADIPRVHLPEGFDWREHDAVTEVKDQGSCGSCWAFSVTGNIEGQWKMQSGELVSLSEQELVDCDKLDEGCNGGLPDNAYRAIEQLGGLETENDYPYEGENDKCAFNKTLSRVQISGAVNISSNETDMAKWLVQNGPISIGINANAMQFYVGGVSHPWRMLCSPSNLDHGVLIVGYGVKDYPLFHKRLPYWIIKNSWGKRWGEQGYYRVYRGDGTCGLNMMASSAVI